MRSLEITKIDEGSIKLLKECLGLLRNNSAPTGSGMIKGKPLANYWEEALYIVELLKVVPSFMTEAEVRKEIFSQLEIQELSTKLSIFDTLMNQGREISAMIILDNEIFQKYHKEDIEAAVFNLDSFSEKSSSRFVEFLKTCKLETN